MLCTAYGRFKTPAQMTSLYVCGYVYSDVFLRFYGDIHKKVLEYNFQQIAFYALISRFKSSSPLASVFQINFMKYALQQFQDVNEEITRML